MHDDKLPAPAPAVSGQTPTAADTLKRVRAFIEYARYVLEPGKAAFPDQFPKQVDADEAMARIDHVLTSLSSAPVASAPTCNKGFPSVAGMRTCRLPLGHAFAHHSRPGDPDDFTWANDEAVTLSSTASAPKDETNDDQTRGGWPATTPSVRATAPTNEVK